MRIRPGVLSLAVLALAALPVAAETARAAPPPAQASITLSDSSALLDSVSITIAPRYEMSWSKSASGTAAEVKEQVAAWEKAVVETDRSYNASEQLIGLHEEQARRCAALASVFADAAKDGYVVAASGSGHASVSTTGEVGSDQWAVSLSTYKPAAVATS